MRPTALIALTIGLAFAAAARACPAPDAPCAVAGGTYRAMAPEGSASGIALLLHGWGGRAEATLDEPHAAALVARGLAVAAPQGEPRSPGDAGGRWNAARIEGRRDDVAFLREVIADAKAHFGDVPVLAAGFSGGGMMVWRLACDAPRSADAFAPVAGLLWRPLPTSCEGLAPLLHVHGLTDGVVPLEGRAVGGGALVQGDLFAGLALMRATNRCADDAPDAYETRGALLVRRWTDCAAPLALALHPGGHITPDGWADLAAEFLAETARRD